MAAGRRSIAAYELHPVTTVLGSVITHPVERSPTMPAPLAENLFIVAKNERAIIKTAAGAELCAWNENWKMKCRVIVRRTRADLAKIFPLAHLTIDPDLVEIREFYCPKSGTLLDVDCVPPTYPVEVDFTPDLEAFYLEWLGRPLPVRI
jgi:acetone carboxylase gamma subunit